MESEVLAPKPPVGYRPPWEQPSEPRKTNTAPAHSAEAARSEGGRRPRSMKVTDKLSRNELTAEERAIRSRVRKAAPACPLRMGEPCTLCQAFVTGPQDCQTVRMVMEDPELREQLAQKRRDYNARKKARKARGADRAA